MLRTTKRDTFHLMSVIGSLSIEQFDNNQDEYRKVINSIFFEFYKFNQKDWEKYYVNICPMCKEGENND